MDIHVLDDSLRRIRIVDAYESFIWTERSDAIGDFVLEFPDTPGNRKALALGSLFVIPNSNRVMKVETVQSGKTNDGKSSIKYTGYSLERVLEHRLTVEPSAGLLSTTKWETTGYPADILRSMFHDVCVDTTVSPDDILSGVLETNVLYPTDTVAEPDDTITYEVTPKTLYAAIRDLASIYKLGFRLVRSDAPQLYFNVYSGVDRTSAQTTYPAVLFSENLGNLNNVNSISSVALYKNVAYVLSPVGYEIVYSSDVTPPVTNFDRQVLLVMADDITDETPSVATAKMIQRGQEELGKNRALSAFDGEITAYGTYEYGVDYNLNDLVEYRDVSGASNIMRVTEQIFVSDKEGDRSYPTLTLDRFITAGSWASPEYMPPWIDMGATTYWNNA